MSKNFNTLTEDLLLRVESLADLDLLLKRAKELRACLVQQAKDRSEIERLIKEKKLPYELVKTTSKTRKRKKSSTKTNEKLYRDPVTKNLWNGNGRPPKGIAAAKDKGIPIDNFLVQPEDVIQQES